jgi:Skp family chaperone for outer membrane proteins
VKRTLIIVGGLAALVAAYVGNQLWAQQGQPVAVAAPATTRIAFVNIETVLQQYTKAKVYKEEMDKMLKPYRDKAEILNKQIIQWKLDLQNGKTSDGKPVNVEQWKNGIKINTRELEDLQVTVGNLYRQHSEKQIVQIYKEVEDAVKTHALTHGFQAVFCYGDSTQIDPLGIENIVRKIRGIESTGCVMAMFMAPGMDISVPVTGALNRSYAAAGAAAAPSGITPTGAIGGNTGQK